MNNNKLKINESPRHICKNAGDYLKNYDLITYSFTDNLKSRDGKQAQSSVDAIAETIKHSLTDNY